MYLDPVTSKLWDADVAAREVAILKDKLATAEKKLESYEYLVAYANDIIKTWPSITMRTLWRMTEKVATLKQALKEIV